MTLTVDSPATIFDMAEMSGAATQIDWAIAKQMWAHGETFVLRENGQAIGLFGLYPMEAGAEAWFAVHPQAARHMLFLTRRIRLTLDAAPYPAIVTFCATEAGKRIARLSGFHFVEHWNNTELWARDGKSIRREVELECGTPATAGSEPAAPAR